MKRDTVLPVLTGLLAVIALPVAGLASAPWLPSSPGALRGWVLGVCALFFLVVPPPRAPRALQPLPWILAASPFLVFSLLAGAAGPRAGGLPPPGWFALAGAVGLLAWTRRPALGAAGLVLVLGGGAVLATADLSLLPARWNPITALATSRSDSDAEQGRRDAPDEAVEGLRPGAPVRLPAGEPPALARGRGPFWVRATVGTRPGPRPVVLVLDGTLRSAPSALRSLPEATIVSGQGVRFDDAFDLLACDALIVRTHAWSEADPASATKARAIAGFVRKGGLLVGPAPDRAWPPELGRALRSSGRGHVPGAAGLQPLGLGRVARAKTRADVIELLDGGAWVPPIASRLSDPMPPAPLPTAGFAWHDEPASRRPQGVLLLVYAAVVAVLTWLVRRRGVQILALLLAAGVVCVALAWIAPANVGWRVTGLVSDLGGPGGRRCEAVVLSAGPHGYEGRVSWQGGGVLALHGGQVTAAGRVRVAPGHTAWIVREVDAQGVGEDDAEDRRAAFLAALLVGEVDPKRLRFGRIEALPIRVEGTGPVPAWTVTWRPK